MNREIELLRLSDKRRSHIMNKMIESGVDRETVGVLLTLITTLNLKYMKIGQEARLTLKSDVMEILKQFIDDATNSANDPETFIENVADKIVNL